MPGHRNIPGKMAPGHLRKRCEKWRKTPIGKSAYDLPGSYRHVRVDPPGPRTILLPAAQTGCAYRLSRGMDVSAHCRVYRHGLPDYTKMSATCGGVLLGITIFDFRRLISLRLRLVDIPIVLLCLCPFASAISNGIGSARGAVGTVRLGHHVGSALCGRPVVL